MLAIDRWIEESGVNPARVVLVGDTVHDGEVADEMGIACLLMEGGHHGRDRLLDSGKPIFQDLASVFGILSQRKGIIPA